MILHMTDISTEEKIKQAAKEVFISKGFEGCSSREIAKAAGMNVSLVNYYFRSKSKLFDLIFSAAMEEFITSMVDVFSRDLSLIDKMTILIDKEYEFLERHPELPAFIINEVNRDIEAAKSQSKMMERIAQTGIFQECLHAQEQGKMRKIDMANMTLLIISNCDFPFMAKNLFMSIHNLSPEDMKARIRAHRNIVKEMLINYLFPNHDSNQ